LTASDAAPVAWPPGLGDLPFDLSADELRRRGAARRDEARRELAALANDRASPTRANLLEPLNRLQVRMRDLSVHGSLLFQVHVDPTVRAAAREVSEASERLWNEQLVDAALYARLRSVDLHAEDESTRFAVGKMLREMRRSGVERLPAERARLLELANEIDRVSNQFAENISSRDRTTVLDGPARLAGLPPDYVASHAPGPDGTIRITTRYPDFLPIMAYCDDGAVRRDLLFEFMNRAYPENHPVLAELLRLRAQFATGLGYSNWAAYALETKMIERPAAAREFLERVATKVRAPALEELRQFLERKRQELGTAEVLEMWDAEAFMGGGYYDTKIRTERFGVDNRALRAYLPYVRVRDGLFELCRELFGLRIAPAVGAPTWHSTVEAFDVTRGSTPVGRFYLDVVPRDGKYGHAACFQVRQGQAGLQLPQSALICNFLDPTIPLDAARMDWRDVVVFFHEFGHLLHAMLSGQSRWLANSMGMVEWDFIEAPSQLFEEWARDPATLARFARNPDTGEPIPEELLRRLRSADAFGRAARYLRQVALATVSLDYYDRDPTGIDLSGLFHASWNRVYPRAQPDGYHPEAAFAHLTGYSAFYYTYLWSVVIARDLLTPFFERGSLTDPESARRYADEILAPGASRPATESIRRFLGRDFRYGAFERWVLEGATGPTGAPKSS
jgi:thimet oligopeptidase